MLSDAVSLFSGTLFFAGLVTGFAALIATLRRAPRSRFRGVISIACLVASGLTLWAIEREPPTTSFLYNLCMYAIPGILAIIFARPPKLSPGHCTTCGYNLRGNVSGKCSECGAPVVAS